MRTWGSAAKEAGAAQESIKACSGGIKGILFTRPSITLPTNTWEVHAPRLPSVVMARMTGWGSDWPSSLMTLTGMWETFSAGLGEPPSGYAPYLPAGKAGG